MPYVHGHARRLGWVMGHHRSPHDAGAPQLALDAEADPEGDAELPGPAAAAAEPAVPAPRVSPEAIPARPARG